MQERIAIFVGATILVLFVVAALVLPFVVEPALKVDYGMGRLDPSWEHPLGTSVSGKDYVSRLVSSLRQTAKYGGISALAWGAMCALAGVLGGLVLMRTRKRFLRLLIYAASTACAFIFGLGLWIDYLDPDGGLVTTRGMTVSPGFWKPITGVIAINPSTRLFVLVGLFGTGLLAKYISSHGFKFRRSTFKMFIAFGLVLAILALDALGYLEFFGWLSQPPDSKSLVSEIRDMRQYLQGTEFAIAIFSLVSTLITVSALGLAWYLSGIRKYWPNFSKTNILPWAMTITVIASLWALATNYVEIWSGELVRPMSWALTGLALVALLAGVGAMIESRRRRTFDTRALAVLIVGITLSLTYPIRWYLEYSDVLPNS